MSGPNAGRGVARCQPARAASCSWGRFNTVCMIENVSHFGLSDFLVYSIAKGVATICRRHAMLVRKTAYTLIALGLVGGWISLEAQVPVQVTPPDNDIV